MADLDHRRRALRLTGILLLAAACSRQEGFGPSPSAAASAAREPRVVRTAVAAEEIWERTLRVTGELAPFEEATLSAKVPGRLEALEVDLGTQVERGQAIAAVDTRDYELRREQAQAAVEAARARLGSALGSDGEVHPEQAAIVREAQSALEDARREAERIATLLTDGVAAQSTYDSAVARRDQAESRWQAALEEIQTRGATLVQREVELEPARQQLADARLVAPFDGAVAVRLAGTGDYLQVGDPVVRLVRFDPVRLLLDVPERSAAQVQLGQEVRVRLESGQDAPGASVTRVSPEISARNRTLRVEVDLPNPDGRLRPGSFARAAIVLDADARSLVMPREALVRFAGIDKVFIVANGVASERQLTVGRVEDDRVEVLSGLEPEEVVVLAPGSLQTGESVVVEP